jgi:tetraacyldisaccharide 4'-kinase
MPLRAPEFWRRDGAASKLLSPLAALYDAAVAARFARVHPAQAGVPVICVGNLALGGAGKTPVVLSLAKKLAARGVKVQILSRGYGGRSRGPLRVDPQRHEAREVGDEPLLLAHATPCWVSADRVAGAREAVSSGAEIILMDDGLQNPFLTKTCSLLVIDGDYGLGNGKVFPSGPLREDAARGLARADAVVVMGEDRAGIAARLAGKTVLRARLTPAEPGKFAGRSFVAFAGIGHPGKFFRSAEEAGARILTRHEFADHHPYRETELLALMVQARAAGASLLTTEKDWVRLPQEWRARIESFPVNVEWREEQALDRLLDDVLKRGTVRR